jgi:hypothetical protein
MRRTSTVVAKFIPGTSRDSITNFFEQHDIDGVCVSDTLNRYAIEVPVGREKQFIELFRTSGMFADVQDNFLGGERPSVPFKKRDGKELRKTVFKKTEEKPEVSHRDKAKPYVPRKELRGGC